MPSLSRIIALSLCCMALHNALVESTERKRDVSADVEGPNGNGSGDVGEEGSSSGSGRGMEEEEEEGGEKEVCANALTSDEGEGDDIVSSTAYTSVTCSLLCMEDVFDNSEYQSAQFESRGVGGVWRFLFFPEFNPENRDNCPAYREFAECVRGCLVRVDPERANFTSNECRNECKGECDDEYQMDSQYNLYCSINCDKGDCRQGCENYGKIKSSSSVPGSPASPVSAPLLVSADASREAVLLSVNLSHSAPPTNDQEPSLPPVGVVYRVQDKDTHIIRYLAQVDLEEPLRLDEFACRNISLSFVVVNKFGVSHESTPLSLRVPGGPVTISKATHVAVSAKVDKRPGFFGHAELTITWQHPPDYVPGLYQYIVKVIRYNTKDSYSSTLLNTTTLTVHSERESDTVFNLGNWLDIQVCTVVGEEEECEVKLYDIPACVYLILNDDIVSNHGYVVISDIGSTDDTALICNTNRPAGNDGKSGGDWFGPDGTAVGTRYSNEHAVPGFRRNRGAGMVQLIRYTTNINPSLAGMTFTPPEGIYHCEVEDATLTQQTVYVGLYSSGGDITISDGLVLTVDSELNGASPQFTLTCISTGGPATTVTWTRDSEDVPGERVTALDNATTAQYTHTLTVTGILEGLYTCTVSNNKPSMASAQLRVGFQVAGTPTNVTTEMINTSTIRVSWSPPTDGDNVTGYILYHTDRDGEKNETRLPLNEQSYIIDHCGENVNISIVALSPHLASVPEVIELLLPQPESVTIYPVNATAVRISWRENQYLSTTVRYLSYFNATGAEMSHYNTVLPPDVASTEVSLDDSVPEYQHTFTLQHIIACDDRTAPVTTAAFEFDKEYFQIQFGPTDYCLNWGLEKTGRIEDQLQSHLTRIIRERCTEFSEVYLRRGFFLCHGNPTTVTYRSTLINPSPTDPHSTHVVDAIQNWVSSAPSLIIDRLLVRVIANCSTRTVSLDDAECVGGGSFLPDSAVTESITRVLSVCAVRQLGQDICTV